MSNSTMQMTVHTRALLQRIACIDKVLGGLYTSELEQLAEAAKDALRTEDAARFVVNSDYANWFFRGDIVTVEAPVMVDGDGMVEAKARDWLKKGRIPFANLEFLAQPE